MYQTNQTKRWVMTALFTALSAVCTMALAIPTPTGGYVNLGDTAVLLGAYLLGPWYGALAGGLGSALADILLGYTAYAPATLVIKGGMAMVAGGLATKLRPSIPTRLSCAAVAECIMITGYWLYDAALVGSLLAAAVGIAPNIVQGCFGTVASTALILVLGRLPAVGQYFPKMHT